eukprot:g2364.t1
MVLISERQQLLFFHVPKCAGESVCKFVQAHVPDAKRYNGILTRGPDRGRDLMHVTPLTAQHVFELASDSRNGLLSGVHGEKRVGRDTVRHLCAALQRYRTFCFVRSPYTRVLSAFEQRRVRWYAQFWGEAPRTLLEMLRQIQARVERDGGWNDPSLVHFMPSSFFSHAPEDHQYRSQAHAQRQTQGLPRPRLHFVGKMESFAEDFAEAMKRFGIDDHAQPEMINQKAKAAGSSGSKPCDGARGWAAHTPETIAIVNRLYEADFRLLGYEMISPDDARVLCSPPLAPPPPLPLTYSNKGSAGEDNECDCAWRGVNWVKTEMQDHCWLADARGLTVWREQSRCIDGCDDGWGWGWGGSGKRQRVDSSHGTTGTVGSDNTGVPFQELLHRRINRDMEPWRARGIDAGAMQQLGRSSFKGLHLKIVDSKLVVVRERASFQSRNRMTLRMLENMVAWCAERAAEGQRPALPNVEFVLHTDDKPPAGCDHLPLFVMAKRDALPWTEGGAESLHILYPDHTFGGWPEAETPQWAECLESLPSRSAQKDVEWAARDPRLFFRGAATNPLRRQLAQLATRPNGAPLLDIMCTDWSKDRGGGKWAVDRSLFVPIADHCKWRYLAHLPGHSYAARLKYLFLNRSTVVWCQDDWQEFYYHTLVPQHHFVQVCTEGDVGVNRQVVSRIQQLRADDAQAQRIAQQGFEFVSTNLTMDAVNEYWYELLTQFAAAQTYDVIA